MANQFAYLLVLRLKMAGRIVKELGWLRTLLLVVLCIAFMRQLFVQKGTGLQWSITILGCAVISTIHFRRSDTPLLRSVVVRYEYVLAAEYLLVTSPLLLILMYHKAFAGGMLLVAFAVMISFLYRRKNNRINSREGSGFPDFLILSYEWIAGLRKHKRWIILLLAAGAGASYFTYIGALVVIFGATAAAALFYSLNEPRRFIVLTSCSPAKFLSSKIGWGTGLYTIGTLPLWIVVLDFYPELYKYTALFWLANLILLTAVIIAKYAFYEEQKNMELPLSTIFAAVGLLLITPYLQIVVPLVMIYLWIRAIRKLKRGVYAYA